MKLILERIKSDFNLIHPSNSFWALGLDDYSVSSFRHQKGKGKASESRSFFFHESWRAEKEKNHRLGENNFGHNVEDCTEH